MAIKTPTDSPPTATRLPFRVLIVPRNGPARVSQPLNELPARLLVSGALAVGDLAYMVENHRPRHRWAEAAFAASAGMETVTIRSQCTCGKCPPTELTVRVASLPHVSPAGVSPENPAPESALSLAQIEERLDQRDAALAFGPKTSSRLVLVILNSLCGLVLGAGGAVGLALLARLLIHWAIGNAAIGGGP